MGIYIQKQVDVYGAGYGVRFRADDGGGVCIIVLIKEDGSEEGVGVTLNWDVAKALGEQMAALAGERM